MGFDHEGKKKKKVRFDNLEAESVKFMAREILVLRRLDSYLELLNCS